MLPNDGQAIADERRLLDDIGNLLTRQLSLVANGDLEEVMRLSGQVEQLLGRCQPATPADPGELGTRRKEVVARYHAVALAVASGKASVSAQLRRLSVQSKRARAYRQAGRA